VWYLRGAAYAGKVFNTAVSGTTGITIKKATLADHVTDTGWSAVYGTDQAVTGNIDVETGYWTFNGQGGDYYANIPYGIKVSSSTTGDEKFGINANSVTVQYVEMAGPGGPNSDYYYAAETHCLGLWPGPNGLISHCYLHGTDTLIDGTGDGLIIEHCVLKDSRSSNPNVHSNVYYLGFGGYNITLRYNRVSNYNDEGFFITGWQGQPHDIYIYGNVFESLSTQGTSYPRGIELRQDYSYTNIYIVNNTFVDVGLGGFLDRTVETGGRCQGCGATNNISVNSPNTVGSLAVSNNTDDSNTGRFVSYSGKNFHLSAPLAGVPLAAAFSGDFDGLVRGADGSWDRGAFEFGSVADTTPPVISAINTGGLTSQGAIVTWLTDENSNGAVDYGLSTAYGLLSSNATFLTAHSMSLSGLSPTTLYHFRVRSRDPAGNSSSSADGTFTTPAPDTVAPSVAISLPTAGTTVANSIIISVNATDNTGGSGVANVDFLVDGNVIGNSVTAPFSRVWDTSTSPNGTHVISAKARDFAGNVGDSQPISVAVANAPVNLATGLVGFWKCDEGIGSTVSDSSPNANHATLAPGLVWAAGKFGSGISFNGSGYLTVPNSSTLQLNNVFSIGAWVYPTILSASWRDIVMKGNDNYYLAGSSGGANGAPAFGGTYAGGPLYGATGLPLNTWTHVAGTYDGATMRLYVNGMEVANKAQSAKPQVTTDVLTIGGDPSYGQFWIGIIDEVRLYNRALTPSEMQGLFKAHPPSIVGNVHFE